jgi:APA family basic amino acid/polyamine antiporter
MREAAGTNAALVFLKIVALAIFILVGGWFLYLNGAGGNYSPFFPNGVSGMFHGAAVIFFAFVGFNTVTVIAEEVKNPSRNVPRALMIALVVCAALYIGVSIVAVGLMNWSALSASDAPLESALMVATQNQLILKYVSIAALFATASVVLSSIFGGSRALYAMARQHLISQKLARVSASGVPVISVILVAIVMSAIVLFSGGNLGVLAQIFNFGDPDDLLLYQPESRQAPVGQPEEKRGFSVPLYPLTHRFSVSFLQSPARIT